MPAGYNSLTVTRTGSGISYSFNATAQTGDWWNVRVVCGTFSAQASGLNNPASVLVTGIVPYTDPEYRTGEKTFTVTQYVRGPDPADEWHIYDYDTQSVITVMVTWDPAALRVVVNGIVVACADIRVKDGNDIKTVVAAYSVEDGAVKPWV